LTHKMYFGLTYFDISGSLLNCKEFKVKNYEKQPDNLVDEKTPFFVKMLLKNDLKALDLSKGKIIKEGVELYAYLLGTNRFATCNSLKVLNLS